MKTPAKSSGSQEDMHAGTDCQGSTYGSCRHSRHYVVISNEFRLADFLEIPGLDLEGLVMLARIEVYEIPFAQVRVHKNRQWGSTGQRAAVATFLGQGFTTQEAVGEAKKFITRAIALGLDLGSGHGPTNHYAHVLRFKEREGMLQDLQVTVETLSQEPVGDLIPEVRSNFSYALPGALDHEDIAAIPGRISQVGERLLICRNPAFGASQHMAKVVLAVMKHDPRVRSAMNIRYSKKMIAVCQGLGLRAVSFDRAEEPEELKAREGSSLERGTQQALEGLGHVPDVVYDEGEVGKEPMIRILGRNPSEVVEKVLKIGKACETN